MIILDMEQGTPEWHEARLGIPTASCFDKIITPTGKPSTQATGYLHKLLAEWLTGTPDSFEPNQWMIRGTELEPDARAFYEFVNDVEIKQVGIVYKDDRRLISCSPDGLHDNGGLEIKCPAPATHVGYMLEGKMPNSYIPQVQGSMYVTGLDSWDFISYHPEMQPVIITVERDKEYIEQMDKLMTKFINEMLVKREILDKQRKSA